MEEYQVEMDDSNEEKLVIENGKLRFIKVRLT